MRAIFRAGLPGMMIWLTMGCTDMSQPQTPEKQPHRNRLAAESSPYLLQHASNPVDWLPWGEEAFAKARAEDKPIFLSIGYSSCHWCHVMAHESFEHDGVAAILNRYFVPVKVDREERPDIDDIYMVATQIMTGRGGWPNSVWLMPDGRPWYAGTYFPREDRLGRPGFITLLTKLAEIWQTQRTGVEEQANQLAAAIRQNAEAAAQGSTDAVDADALLVDAMHELSEGYDARHGGFGSAPKFPPHTVLDLLMRAPRLEPFDTRLQLITGTLDAIMLGGIRDHIGGGFHRYSTDAEWLVPHFEKMLYDNAQLAAAFANAFALTRKEEYATVARETCDWVLREMTGPEGGFYSALDADSEGEEGRFYVWSHEEILRVLGSNDGEHFCKTYGVLPGGNFQDEASGDDTGFNIPHLAGPVREEAGRLNASILKLRDVRSKRIWPGLDDKVITSWNGLMISALAQCGKILNEPSYTQAAEKAARFILRDMRHDGNLLHTWRKGTGKGRAYLDDYSALANALLDLSEATGNPVWRKETAALMQVVLDSFQDKQRGGFYFTSEHHEDLITRTRDAFDQAMPSASSLTIRALVRLGEPKGLEAAVRAMTMLAPAMKRSPTGTAALLHAALLLKEQRATPPPAVTDVVSIAIHPKARSVHAGGEVDVDVMLTISNGWHVQANKPSLDYLIGTSIAVAGDFTLKSASFPSGKTLKLGDDELRVYSGSLSIPATLLANPNLMPPFATAKVTVTWQACDDGSCQAPQSSTHEITLRVSE